MKKQISLSLPKRCAEKWSGFTPTSAGAFCSACSKNVVDFTKMDDDEIIAFFSRKPVHICGRFLPGQLKAYPLNTSSSTHSGLKWIYAGCLSLMLVLISKQASATSAPRNTRTEIVHFQHEHDENSVTNEPGHIIKGLVTDENKEPLAGVTVYLKGADIGTVTDLDGRFKFPKALKTGDVLVISLVGFENQEYVVPKDAPEIVEIPMLMLDMQLMGEVMVDGPYEPESSGIDRLWQKFKSLF